MPVLERSELESSPLADLHAIADQIGLDGFRRLRNAVMIDAILVRCCRSIRSATCSAVACATSWPSTVASPASLTTNGRIPV